MLSTQRRFACQLFVLALVLCSPIPTHGGISKAGLQCQYSFADVNNLIPNPTCVLTGLSAVNQPLSPPIPATPSIASTPLSTLDQSSWAFTPGWNYNPTFECCSFTTSSTTNATDPTAGTSVNSTLITTVDLSPFTTLVDLEQQTLEISISYYTSHGPSSSNLVDAPDAFWVVVRFLDGTGAYLLQDSADPSSVLTTTLSPGLDERLIYYSFDAVTLDQVRIPKGARAVVVQVLVPPSSTQYCFDFFAMQMLESPYHPDLITLIGYAMMGVGAIVFLNAVVIPIILFRGLPGWWWRTAPVNFFQKNPVVDHYVPLALFISTCQWIYNIIFHYLCSRASVMHSPQAAWLIPILVIGVFFLSAFAHWALFLCYNQSMLHHSRTKSSLWVAPALGLWAVFCIIGLRLLVILMAIIQGSFWSLTIGILLAVPEMLALVSVAWYFLKTLWASTRKDSHYRASSTGSSQPTTPSRTTSQDDKQTGILLPAIRIRTSLSNDSKGDTTWADKPEDEDFSSHHHQAYVKNLLVSERDRKAAAGSMYGHSTFGSSQNTTLPGGYQPNIHKKGQGAGRPTAAKAHQVEYLGSGLGGGMGSDRSTHDGRSSMNTTITFASSSATEYSKNINQYEFNIGGGNYSTPSTPGGMGRGGRPPSSRAQSNISSSPGSAAGGGRGGRYERNYLSPPNVRNSNMYGDGNKPHDKNNNKLTWNSSTTSYTTTSAAQPMTGAAPTPSAWEYVIHPHQHIWPSLTRTYLLIARLPLRILVAVLTTLCLCYDVLLSIGAAEYVLAQPVSCYIGSMAYPGSGQFDNTMNVARAMHTVNLVLVVVLLPAVVCITMVHQVRMVQKYNWCLRLLRLGNYGFVPGGRDHKQHLKHPVRFIGYTVGFGVVGLCFTIFLLLTLGTLVAMLLVAATFRSTLFRSLGTRALIAFGICLLIISLLWIVQMLVIKYRFRMRGSRFHISRQASFHHWEFFWAFFNIVFGAISFCKRIGLSTLSLGIYSTRIDLCIMGGRFRPWDGGYSAFVGLVLADHVHNNPIMLEFVQIMRDLLKSKRRYASRSGQGLISPSSDQLQQRKLVGPGVTRGKLYDIDEGGDERMEDLLSANSKHAHMAQESNGGGQGVGQGLGRGLAVPVVSKVHHYFRLDPRVERHGENQGPVSPEGVSKVYSHLLFGDGYIPNNRSTDAVSGNANTAAANSAAVGAIAQDPVSQEQIRTMMAEARARSTRARNRWFLYLTLARNPSLRALRRTKAEDFLYPIDNGYSYAGANDEEDVTDITWDRED